MSKWFRPSKKALRAVVRGFATVAIVISFSTSIAEASEVCTAIADASTGHFVMQRGDCQTRVTPASTFKIALSLMGYDTHFLKDEHHPELPFREGYLDWRESWKQPTDPARWITESVVWYSQQITTSLGMSRLHRYAAQFNYGNADVSGDQEHDGLTMSWIGSSLKISPLEQIGFLRNLVNHKLGVSQHAYNMTERLLAYKRVGEWDISGKTGSSSGYGWYVGWATQGQRKFVFAHLLRAEPTDQAGVPAGVLARDGFIDTIPELLASSQTSFMQP